MSADAEATPGNRELVLHRTLGASRDKLYRCWTEADLLTQWFTPPPWTTPFATLDVRPGGANLVLMRGPKGEEMPNRGVYLEVVPNERLVFTDAYVDAWVPVGEAVHDGDPHLRGRGSRQDGLHGPGPALDAGGLRRPRGDGLREGLGHRDRSARGAGEDALMTGGPGQSGVRRRSVAGGMIVQTTRCDLGDAARIHPADLEAPVLPFEGSPTSGMRPSRHSAKPARV